MRCVSLAGILLLFCRGHLPHLLEGLALLVKGLVGIVMKLARQVDDNTLFRSLPFERLLILLGRRCCATRLRVLLSLCALCNAPRAVFALRGFDALC